jgi:L-ascorbate metabolism protein UlaG (beta-lactamase superfamily)
VRIASHGHACVVVETAAARLLVDPGTFSPGFEELDDLDGVLVTHGHGDHLDVRRLSGLLARIGPVPVLCDADSVGTLREAGIAAEVVVDGDVVDLGAEVRVFGERHEPVHHLLDTVANVGFVVDGRFAHPGDALVPPPVPVEALAVPAAGPWLSVAQAIDYLRVVAPPVALPIHLAGLTRPESHARHLGTLAPSGTRVVADHVVDLGPGPVDGGR